MRTYGKLTSAFAVMLFLFILTLFEVNVSLCAMSLDFTAATQRYNQPIDLLLALNANVLINLLVCFYSSACNVQLFGSLNILRGFLCILSDFSILSSTAC